MNRIVSCLNALLTLLRLVGLLRPIPVPTSTEEVEALAASIGALFVDENPDFQLIVRRRVAEAVLHGANKRIFVLRLRFYMEIRMALASGAGFATLEQVKTEEKAREQQRKEATAALAT